MTVEQALYLRDGDAFVGTACTKGSWHADGQSGGAVLALLGHVLEEVPTLVPMSLTRLTVDLVRPVPVGERLQLDHVVLREGKKIHLVDLVVRAGEVDCVRARALRVRDLDVRELDGMPRSTTEDDPASLLPPNDQLAGVEDLPGTADFLRYGAEMRRTVEPVDGLHGVRLRLRVPVVAGEPVRPTSMAALPLDMVNLIGVSLNPARATTINPDVTGHLFRPPVGEWIALTGNTRYSHLVGHGMSTATISDDLGVVGVTSTSQLIDPRA